MEAKSIEYTCSSKGTKFLTGKNEEGHKVKLEIHYSRKENKAYWEKTTSENGNGSMEDLNKEIQKLTNISEEVDDDCSFE